LKKKGKRGIDAAIHTGMNFQGKRGGGRGGKRRFPPLPHLLDQEEKRGMGAYGGKGGCQPPTFFYSRGGKGRAGESGYSYLKPKGGGKHFTGEKGGRTGSGFLRSSLSATREGKRDEKPALMYQYWGGRLGGRRGGANFFPISQPFPINGGRGEKKRKWGDVRFGVRRNWRFSPLAKEGGGGGTCKKKRKVGVRLRFSNPEKRKERRRTFPSRREGEV